MNRDARAGLILRVVVVLVGIGCLAGLIHVLSVIALRVPLDPNEGWNAYFAQAAMLHGTPYPAADSLMTNNYPPLSFYLVGLLGGPSGDAIIAGRAVALIAFLTTTALTALAARRMGCSRSEATLAALLFAACLLLTTDYVGMDDPQLIAHAVSLAGLLIVVREHRTPREMVAAAFVFVIAFFIKHNVILLPLALAAWLFLLNRRLAFVFVISGATFLLIGMGLFREVFGTSLLTQLNAPRLYDIANIPAGLASWIIWAAVPLASVAVLLSTARRDQYATLCAIYALVAVGGGVLFLGGSGVDANALFDADIALSLCAAVTVNRMAGYSIGRALPALYAIPLAILLLRAEPGWQNTDYWMHPIAADTSTARGEIALLKSTKGRALCEMLSLCYWAGKPAEVDTFNLGQQFATGTRSDKPPADLIAARTYAIIELETPSDFAMTPRLRAAVAENYRTLRQDDDRVFLVPR